MSKNLNIFIDETGNFGFGKDTSELYGLSFVFHNSNDSIKKDIEVLNERLNKINYRGMIHTSELVSKRDEYANFSLEKRKVIFNYLFQFTIKAKINIHSIIINKNYCNNERQLKNKLFEEVNNMVNNNKEYFNSFDKIVIYYDNGQEPIKLILKEVFSQFINVEYKVKFDKIKKRLFQVADMLTFIDKYDYKYNNKLYLNKSEKIFFNLHNYNKIIRDLNHKRL